MSETFGVANTIHPEWYNEDPDWIDATLLFGTRLAEDGYDVKYMHGPVCLYEGAIITAISMRIPDEELRNFTPYYKHFTKNNPKNYIYFLYKVKGNRVRYARVSNIDWEYVSKKQAVKSQSQVMDEEV